MFQCGAGGVGKLCQDLLGGDRRQIAFQQISPVVAQLLNEVQGIEYG